MQRDREVALADNVTGQGGGTGVCGIVQQAREAAQAYNVQQAGEAAQAYIATGQGGGTGVCGTVQQGREAAHGMYCNRPGRRYRPIVSAIRLCRLPGLLHYAAVPPPHAGPSLQLLCAARGGGREHRGRRGAQGAAGAWRDWGVGEPLARRHVNRRRGQRLVGWALGFDGGVRAYRGDCGIWAEGMVAFAVDVIAVLGVVVFVVLVMMVMVAVLVCLVVVLLAF